MKRVSVFGAVALLFGALSAVGCKKASPDGRGSAEATKTAEGGGASTGAARAPALLPVGMADPFARLTTDSLKALKAGYAAFKAKKYDDARDAFGKVEAAVPDYTSAIYMEARAAALGGHFGDVPALWSKLLARDFVAYAGKLDKPKDLSALRAAPEWSQIKDLESQYKTAYAAGLDKGFFFVARTKDAPAPKYVEGIAKLDPNQEVFHYDPANKVYRRMTETGGHAFAITLSPDRKTLSFVTVSKLSTQQGPADPEIVDPQGGLVDLATLETVGPLVLKGTTINVFLYFTAKGEPVWDGAEAYQLDAARTAMVKVERVDVTAENLLRTWAGASAVNHGGKQVQGAHLSGDAMAVEIDGVDKPLRAARPLAPTTLEWSPSKKRLAYAGVLDACKLIGAGKAGKDDKNELFLWDADKKAATRIASAVSAFDSLWLDDDHLVYEGGVGKDGKLHVFEVSTRSDTVLKPRYGAGLFGYPTLSCEDSGEVDTVADEDAGE